MFASWCVGGVCLFVCLLACLFVGFWCWGLLTWLFGYYFLGVLGICLPTRARHFLNYSNQCKQRLHISFVYTLYCRLTLFVLVVG